MTSTDDEVPDPDGVEQLLPWLANGRLSRQEAERVGIALESDAELLRRLGLVQEEMGETVRLNEALGAPSAEAVDRVFSRIDAEPARRQSRPLSIPAAGRWLRDRLERASPRSLAWAAVAALLIIAVQAGLLTVLVDGRVGTGVFQTAQGPRDTLDQGSFALVDFAPEATSAQITAFLHAFRASIVEGPRERFYRLRLSGETLAPADIEAILQKMRAETAVIRFAAPAP